MLPIIFHVIGYMCFLRNYLLFCGLAYSCCGFEASSILFGFFLFLFFLLFIYLFVYFTTRTVKTPLGERIKLWFAVRSSAKKALSLRALRCRQTRTWSKPVDQLSDALFISFSRSLVPSFDLFPHQSWRRKKIIIGRLKAQKETFAFVLNLHKRHTIHYHE